MNSVSGKALSPQELHERITTTQANIIEALVQLEAATVQIGNPKPIRQALDKVRELLTVLWLLHDTAMHPSNQQQHPISSDKGAPATQN